MSKTITVRNLSRRPVALEGGRVLAHGERGLAPDSAHTRALIEAGQLHPVSAGAGKTMRKDS